MQKFTIMLLAIVFSVFTLHAQIIDENFDSYTAGQKLADQAGSPWTTWSSAPGGNEDPTISDEQSETAPNSAKIVSGNDCVLLLGDSTSGRYKISFDIYVPANKLGYFNILQEFNGTNSLWGTQLYFDANGQGRIDAGAESAASFEFNYDEWISFEAYIDLNSDWADIFVGGNYLVGWQWTLGTFGTPGPNQLGAVNLFAWDGSKKGTPEFYFDNMLFASINLGEAPQNLAATVDGHVVSLTWEAPASGTPLTYYVFKNNELVGISPELTFEEEIDYPGTYTYTVKAMYLDSGLSPESNPIDATIAGGTDRNFVLVEIATGTGCPYCPGAAMGADDLIANGHKAAIVEYHNYNDDDPYKNQVSTDRTSYYGITAYPTAVFDGGNVSEGGNATTSLYAGYAPKVEERITLSSFFELGIDVVATSETDFDVTVNATNIYEYTGTNTTIHLALTESNIEYAWQNQSHLDFVCRDMYPNAGGTETTFVLNEEVSVNHSINVPYTLENCELVAFIQDMDSKEILQTTKINIGQTVGIAELGEKYINMYPNPANDNVTIETKSNIKNINLYDLNGRKVYSTALDNNSVTLNVDFLNSGLYIVNITTENGEIIEKLNIR